MIDGNEIIKLANECGISGPSGKYKNRMYATSYDLCMFAEKLIENYKSTFEHSAKVAASNTWNEFIKEYFENSYNNKLLAQNKKLKAIIKLKKEKNT